MDSQELIISRRRHLDHTTLTLLYSRNDPNRLLAGGDGRADGSRIPKPELRPSHPRAFGTVALALARLPHHTTSISVIINGKRPRDLKKIEGNDRFAVAYPNVISRIVACKHGDNIWSRFLQ
jgi:hypothetical protein